MPFMNPFKIQREIKRGYKKLSKKLIFAIEPWRF
jgi:hypothetical protein